MPLLATLAHCGISLMYGAADNLSKQQESLLRYCILPWSTVKVETLAVEIFTIFQKLAQDREKC